MYQHILNGKSVDLPLGKIVCVGRNYAAHAKELNNPVPSSPILFIKPATAAITMADGIALPAQQGECHHELEMSVLIGETLKNADETQVGSGVLGFGLGLDLTLREVQAGLKEKGHPWELAKSFDGACPLTEFVSVDRVSDPHQTELTLEINGELRQQGNTRDMITPLYPLLAFMSRHFSLMPGDVVLTGTPAGVGPLHKGDELFLQLGDVLSCSSIVK
ncbi:fumarylacetoacetate hydrolase family protein [Ketobacter sp. MCCC 1A13808]|uniref:fumarylacetoacetate hydrolase family protein n=1 Tax=Ketobacter sp. MCCC 1A13808 TaxID=2602738 RepID=UPI000F1FE0E6|nr:fumarylacetoacetate hydrolase family protein [Ketobacter sp. MCCC 1A13808]MVF11843.1 fumarylacetoacetate hydrolase family protein [Ketobacter sp. MCCC 1A13808]RLP55444.1 MAG: fumarylacetoacetate hydrolase family protein [Ketobacter sp.]